MTEWDVPADIIQFQAIVNALEKEVATVEKFLLPFFRSLEGE